MVIEIDDVQADVLRDLIDSRLGNLSSEIRHTVNKQLRQGLRDERVALLGLVDTLGPTVQALEA